MVHENMGFKQIGEKWIKAFNDRSIEDLLGLYNDNARHYSPRIEEMNPETKGWIIGKEQLKAWWQGSFDRLPGLHYELKGLVPGNTKLFIEYVRKVPGQKDLYTVEYLKIEDNLIVESKILASGPA